MIKKPQGIVLLLSLLLLANSIAAQFVFQKSYFNASNDQFSCIIQTQDGGFAAIGQSLNVANNNDIWLLKTNANGDVEFSKSYSSNGTAIGNSIKQLPNGDYIICGNITVSPATTSQIFIARLDFQGTILWSKTYDANKNEEANSLIISSNNEIIVAGHTTSVGLSLPKGLLFATDLNGNLIWTKVYTQINSELFNKVTQTSDGGFIAVGSIVLFGNTDKDIVVTKVDALGNLQWSYSYGDLGGEEATDVIQVGTDYYITGNTASAGAGSQDFFILHLASYGGIMNGRVIGTGLSENAFNIQLLNPTTLVVSGYAELSITPPIREVCAILNLDLNLNVFQALYLGDSLSQSRIVSSVITNLGKVAMAGFYKQQGQSIVNGFIAQNNLSYSQVCNEYYPIVNPVAYIPNYNQQNFVVNATLIEQNFTFTTTNPVTFINSLCFTTEVPKTQINTELKITPNPVTDYLQIQSINTINFDDAQINITSVTGAVLISSDFITHQAIDVKALKPGIYFLQIKCGTNCYNSKFIKQ